MVHFLDDKQVPKFDSGYSCMTYQNYQSSENQALWLTEITAIKLIWWNENQKSKLELNLTFG